MNEQISELHVMIGELVMELQCIENDIKMIYACMSEGKFEDNLNEVESNTLGLAIKKLKELDETDTDQYFSSEEYARFEDIVKRRNYWVHQGYIDLIYDEEAYAIKLDKKIKHLTGDLNYVRKAQEKIQNVKVSYFAE